MCCFTPECVDCQGRSGVHLCPWPLTSDSPAPTRAAAAPRSFPASPTGPRCVVRAEVSPDAIARFDGGARRRSDAALAAYDDAVAAVADGFAAKAEKALRRGRRGADRERRPGPRQGAARGGRARTLAGGDDLLTAVHAGASSSSPTMFTSMGGLMAERVTDLRDIERRVVAHLVGRAGARRAHARRAVGAGRRGPRAVRHRGPRPGGGGRAGDRARWPHQPHRDHRPPARHPLRRGRRRRHGASTAGTCAAGRRRRPARSRSAPTPTRPRRGSPPAGRRAPRWPPGPARPRPPTASRSSSSPTSPTAQSAVQAARGAGARASASSAPSSASSTARRSRASRSRPTIYAEVLGAFGEGAVRRGPHPRRRLGQADRVRDHGGRGEPRARRARAAAVASATPA